VEVLGNRRGSRYFVSSRVKFGPRIPRRAFAICNPPFGFQVYLAATSHVEGWYNYTLMFAWLQSAFLATSWTQVYGNGSGPNPPKEPVSVELLGEEGNPRAQFNSSMSNWVPGTGLNTSLPSMGGWIGGENVSFNQTDFFVVSSALSLAGDTVWVAISVSIPPHASSIQSINL